MNPLLFPEVLDIVFNYVPVVDLFNCRLVSRTWNEEACCKLQSRVEITFNSVNDVEEYNDICEDVNFADADSTIQMIKRVHPLSKYKFFGNWSSNPWQSALQTFFNNSNKFITSLDLKACGWSLWDFTIFFSEMELPNIKSLSFECPSQQQRQKQQLLSICYKQNTIQLSTLESLEVSELKNRAVPWICGLIETNKHLKTFSLMESRIIRTVPFAILESLVLNQSFQKLENLHLDYYLTNAQLILIGKHFPVVLPLKSLSFALLATTEPMLMYNFFKSISHSLRKLHLEYEYSWEKISLDQFRFPPLEKLNHLSIKFLKGSLNSLLMNVQSLNLKTLTLCGFESVENTGEVEFERSVSLEQLSIVSSPSCTFYIDEIYTLFPTLKYLKLQGQLTNGILHSIITKLTSLEEMFLSPQRSYFSDEGLIGDALEVFHPSRPGSENCVGSPCICQLKALNTLHLELNPKLSDAVVNGIRHCRSLRSLTLKSPRLTETSLLNLLEKMNLESLTFHGGQVSPDSICKAVEKVTDCDVQEITSFDIRIILHSRNNVITCRVI